MNKEYEGNIGYLLRQIRIALGHAVKAIYFDDSSDYEYYLWKVIKVLGGQEVCDLLENNREEAYNQYCEHNE